MNSIAHTMETGMKFENAVYPNEEQIKGFTEGDHGEPISMVNLLKFKEKAEGMTHMFSCCYLFWRRGWPASPSSAGDRGAPQANLMIEGCKKLLDLELELEALLPPLIILS